MSGHTPGPWFAERRHIGEEEIRRRRIDERTYELETRPVYGCFVQPLQLQVYGPDWQHDKHDYKSSRFISANARLIAAAPELLDACRETAKHPCFDFPGSSCEKSDGTGLWCAACLSRAVIAKAEGRS